MAAHGAAVVVNDLGVTVDGKKNLMSPADEVVAEIKASGGVAVGNAMDIATVSGGQDVVDHAIREFGKLDILVNVAGILRDRMIFNMAEEEWDEVIRVHLKGHYALSDPPPHICASASRGGSLTFRRAPRWGLRDNPTTPPRKPPSWG